MRLSIAKTLALQSELRIRIRVVGGWGCGRMGCRVRRSEVLVVLVDDDGEVDLEVEVEVEVGDKEGRSWACELKPVA